MAKRMQNMRQQPTEERRKGKERCSDDQQQQQHQLLPSKDGSNLLTPNGGGGDHLLNPSGDAAVQQQDDGGSSDVQIKEAKVTKPTVSPDGGGQMTDHQLLTMFQEERTAKEQIELATFEELERTLKATTPHHQPQHFGQQMAPPLRHGSPDKTSRDSGVITPSEGSRTSPEHNTNLISMHGNGVMNNHHPSSIRYTYYSLYIN